MDPSAAAGRYPKARIDALSDGVFAVAMTLLVLDLHLPDALAPDAPHLAAALVDLWPKFAAYALSFAILGMRWLSNAQVTSRAEHFSGSYLAWWLFYLLLITCVPFTTTLVGRFAGLAPATWLYAANTGLLAVAAGRMAALTPELHDPLLMRRRQWGLAVLLASALLCFGLSFVLPKLALWAFALNFIAPALTRRLERKR